MPTILLPDNVDVNIKNIAAGEFERHKDFAITNIANDVCNAALKVSGQTTNAIRRHYISSTHIKNFFGGIKSLPFYKEYFQDGKSLIKPVNSFRAQGFIMPSDPFYWNDESELFFKEYEDRVGILFKKKNFYLNNMSLQDLNDLSIFMAINWLRNPYVGNMIDNIFIPKVIQMSQDIASMKWHILEFKDDSVPLYSLPFIPYYEVEGSNIGLNPTTSVLSWFPINSKTILIVTPYKYKEMLQRTLDKTYLKGSRRVINVVTKTINNKITLSEESNAMTICMNLQNNQDKPKLNEVTLYRGLYINTLLVFYSNEARRKTFLLHKNRPEGDGEFFKSVKSLRLEGFKI